MYIINYCIALIALGEDKASLNLLKRKDWSAVSLDFRLAYSVITKDWSEAQKFMLKLGREGELVNEMSYHDWPLFRQFRETTEFYEGYSEVFGYRYSEKLNLLAKEEEQTVVEADLSEE